MKVPVTVLGLLLLFSLAGCRDHKVGAVHVDGDSKPRFRFVGLHVGRLVVYRVLDKYLKAGIPADELKENNANTQWFIEGNHTANEPILYGAAPPGMKEAFPAKSLDEGVVYFVSSYVGTYDTGAFVGQYFRIKNGRTEEFHEEVN
jgi:hypothetical protein